MKDVEENTLDQLSALVLRLLNPKFEVVTLSILTCYQFCPKVVKKKAKLVPYKINAASILAIYWEWDYLFA